MGCFEERTGSKMSAPVPATLPPEIKMQMAELQEALLSAHPKMPTLLKEIHGMLQKDPACVTIMAEEEIQIIVRGLEKVTATVLAEAVTSKTPKKSLKSTSVDDL
jgi:hypothetical protein